MTDAEKKKKHAERERKRYANDPVVRERNARRARIERVRNAQPYEEEKLFVNGIRTTPIEDRLFDLRTCCVCGGVFEICGENGRIHLASKQFIACAECAVAEYQERVKKGYCPAIKVKGGSYQAQLVALKYENEQLKEYIERLKHKGKLH